LLKADQVNILLHGHNPVVSEMVARAAEDPELVALAEKALQQTEKRHGPNAPQVGKALFTLADQHSFRGEDDKQLPLLERAVKILEKAPDQDAELMANCFRGLGFCYRQKNMFAQAVKAYERELEIHEKGGGNDLEFKEVQKYLERTRQEQRDFEARKAFPAVVINGVKATIPPDDISRIVADPKKEAQALLDKGGEKRHEEMGGKAVMVAFQGVPHTFLSTDIQKMAISGHDFRVGDTTYSFAFDSDEAMQAFRDRHKLQKTIKLRYKFDDQDFTLYDAGEGVFVRVGVYRNGFKCSGMECKDRRKKHPKEGVCPTCGQRLYHIKYLE